MCDGSEFIEFTNLGVASVDFNGWSFADDSDVPGTVDLAAFGIVASDALVDRLTYGDQTVGGPRTQGRSGVPGSPSVVGANDATQWTFSVAGIDGAKTSTGGQIGSPGFTTLQPVPSLRPRR